MATDTFDLFAERPRETPPEEKRALRVSELNHRAAAMLEEQFSRVLVEGEISGFLAHRSGHWYFNLKDANAQVACCCFKGNQRWIQGKPKDGDHVVVRGKLTIYGARGNYQLVVEHIKAAGQGALLEQLEALKQKLAAEGLFENKRALPPIVRTVGLVTSPDGAAVRDYLRVALQRDPGLRVVIFPTPVQGPGAALQVAQTIRLASERAKTLGLDVVVVTRGGGSIEDLWAFNDERVARAIVACTVPCVSAIGHEIDTTLADYVADVRAPTPTAAAQITSADMMAVREQITRYGKQMIRAMRNTLNEQRVRLHRTRLPDPRRLLSERRQDIDALTQQMERAVRDRVARAQQRLRRDERTLQAQHPRQRVHLQRSRTVAAQQRLERAIKAAVAARKKRIEGRAPAFEHAISALVAERRERLARLAATLDALSPLAVLGRGYALAKKNGHVLRKSAEVDVGDDIDIRLEDGELSATVKGKRS